MTQGQNEPVSVPGIGTRLREAREREGLTQTDLAGTEYSVSYISAVERGRVRPSLRALSWLASRLNMNLADLLTTNVPLTTDVMGGEEGLQSALSQAQIDIAERHFDAARDRLLAVRDQVQAPSRRVQLNLLLSEAYVELGQALEAKEVLEQNLILTREVDPISQELSRNLLGLAYVDLHMPMLALECHRQCLQAIESHIVRDPSFELNVLANLGQDYIHLGQHDESVKVLERAAELGKKMQTPQGLASLYWQVSESYRQDGRATEAQRYAEMATEHLRQGRNRQVIAHIQTNLGLEYAERHENERAETLLQEARDLAERIGDAPSRSATLATLSRVQLARGATAKALESARAALVSAEESKSQEAIGRAHLAVGEAQAASGKTADADKSFAKGLDLLEKSGAQAELTLAYEHYADLLNQRGEAQKAFEYLKRARATGGAR